VSHADAKTRHLPENFLARLYRVLRATRVARTVGEENPVRVHGEDVSRGGIAGDDGDLAPVRREAEKDVPLDAEVVRDDVEVFLGMGLQGDQARKEKNKRLKGEVCVDLCRCSRLEV
jgi:hypothetical protein